MGCIQSDSELARQTKINAIAQSKKQKDLALYIKERNKKHLDDSYLPIVESIQKMINTGINDNVAKGKSKFYIRNGGIPCEPKTKDLELDYKLSPKDWDTIINRMEKDNILNCPKDARIKFTSREYIYGNNGWHHGKERVIKIYW